jgi:hypothetical protein
MYATRSGRFGGAVSWSNRFTTNPLRIDAALRATQLESFRFFGYGNETSLPPLSQIDVTLVDLDLVEGEVIGIVELGEADLGLGGVVRYTDPRPREGSPLVAEPGMTRVGARAVFALQLPAGASERLGASIGLEAEGFPAVWNLESPLASVDGLGEMRIRIPLGGRAPDLTVRVGGRHVWGDSFPVDESAFIGGRETIRGYRYSRFAGRSSAFGSAELRVPLFELELLTRGRLGVLAFEDIGRVWWDTGDSRRWHSGYGGGLWFESLGFTMSAQVARGEETRYYLGFESPL